MLASYEMRPATWVAKKLWSVTTSKIKGGAELQYIQVEVVVAKGENMRYLLMVPSLRFKSQRD